MIIWLNGTFGVGKTETAKALHEKLKPSHIYDPELVGQFLWYTFPEDMKRKGDFQDIPLWRSMNHDLIRYLCEQYPGDLIIPMTIANPAYENEIIGQLRREGIPVQHFLLAANRSVVHQRLVGRGEPEHSWAEAQMESCLDGFSKLKDVLEINTENLSISEVVEMIFRHDIKGSASHA